MTEFTRERVPLDWAKVQNELGFTLHTLGDQENGTDRLQQAITCYREALKEIVRDRDPAEWGEIGATPTGVDKSLARRADGRHRR